MSDKNPEYVPSRISLNKRIATKCRICGGQLTDPLDMQKETHKECKNNYKRKTYGVS